MNSILLFVLCLMVAKVVFDVFLDYLNLRHVKKRSGSLPEAFEGVMDETTYARSNDYTRVKGRFSILTTVVDALILIAVLISGVGPLAYEALSGFFGYGVWGQAVILFVMIVGLSLLSVPFELYRTFRIEGTFGFNNSSFRLWLTDKIKGILLGAAIGIPLLALLIYLVTAFGQFWWVYGFVFFFAFQIVMVVAFPMFIMPLFNKLEPLKEGTLKSRLFALAERSGFAAKTILVMDGSKRSGHSNAFFAGFGKLRRIVLYDTLIEQMTTEELEAVLAHEIGHYKLGHIPKMIAVSAATTFIMFAVLGFLAQADWFVTAFGFGAEHVGRLVPVLFLVSLLASYFTFWITPLTAILSRKHEYEADAFAADAVGTTSTLSGALRQLHRKNLSNLQPHPLYSAFYYSHPTLIERETALRQLEY